MDAPYPLTFEPVFRDYVWGGRSLETRLGRTIPDGIVAESWEISGHPSSPTVVDQGPLRGRTLPEVLELQGEALVGRRSRDRLEAGKFPLLVKLLDANRPLSVQVHPDDAYAMAHEGGELGKTEMWYILHAEPGAELIYGVTEGVTRERFREALEEGSLEACLHRLPVEAGDTVFIPAGSVHAILEGIVLAEIQQSSDTTYRVYDWNRVDADGRPRPLHIEKALDVIDFDQVKPGPQTAVALEAPAGVTRERLVSCPHFEVERLTVAPGGVWTVECTGETFELLGVIEGEGGLEWDGGSFGVEAVRFVLVPARLGTARFQAGPGGATALRAFVP